MRLSNTSRASGFNVASILTCNKQQGSTQAFVIRGLHMKRVVCLSNTSKASGFNVDSILTCNKQQGSTQAFVIWGLI